MEKLFPEALDFISLYDEAQQPNPSSSSSPSTISARSTPPILQAFASDPTCTMSVHPLSVNPLAVGSTTAPSVIANSCQLDFGKVDKATRRTMNHRSAERRRRQSIKEGMARLQGVLSASAARCDLTRAEHLKPFAGGRQPSKVQLLDASIDHIEALQIAVIQLARENDQLRRRASI